MKIHFREDTNDSLIFDEIFKRNAYKLPEKFLESDIIIDIGAHLGFFTSAVVQRGAQKVYAVEAETENYQLAQEYLKDHIDRGNVSLSWEAVWRSDSNEKVLYHSGYNRNFDCQITSNLVNTGGGDVIWQTHGEMVPVIAFDTLILKATEEGQKKIRLLKIDCEGSEWPILFTSNTLHLIDEICGEFHEIGGKYDALKPPFFIPGFEQFTVQELSQFFKEKNFDFTSTRLMRSDGLPSRLGMFFATQKRE
jgi:FkbM family methyltransferase